jgi:hypothetical protein
MLNHNFDEIDLVCKIENTRSLGGLGMTLNEGMEASG